MTGLEIQGNTGPKKDVTSLPDDQPGNGRQFFWLWVMCLLGLDYFSTLAYQPSITYEVAGRLGPLATGMVVLATLFGVLPLYCYLAGRSPTGFGSIGMLEKVVRGWRGKTLVLLLLGFAATDFVMLKTISLADAAEHLLKSAIGPQFAYIGKQLPALDFHKIANGHSPIVAGQTASNQLVVTLLLTVIGFFFWFILRKGFNRNVIALAVPLVGMFLLMSGLIIGGGIKHLLENPAIFQNWQEQIYAGDWQVRTPAWLGGGWFSALLVSLLFLPHLALGLSGFEMSLILMPQVRGSSTDDPYQPQGRIANTRKVLIAAASIMSLYLLGSSLVACLLIRPEAMMQGGAASHRVLAYLAHGGPLVTEGVMVLPFCGPLFGSIYDFVTVLVLCLAGTSVMTALSVLLPQFLLRFGMQLHWAHRWGVLLMLFAFINFLVTLDFQASVDAQRGAYTTSVLVLMSCAGVVCALDRKRMTRGEKVTSAKEVTSDEWQVTSKEEKPTSVDSPSSSLVTHHLSLLPRHSSLLTHYFFLVAAGLVVMAMALAMVSLSGVLIASLFIFAILGMSILSRALRVDELRTIGFDFRDEPSKFLWDSLRLADFPVLVPHRPGMRERDLKEIAIRRDHQLDPEADIVFLEVEVDDPSNFFQNLLIEVVREKFRFVIRVTRCVSVAHAIAAVALEMSRFSKPPGCHFGWSEIDLLTASWNYFAFGEGNVPWKVRELILRSEPDPDKQPRVIIG